MEAPLALDRAAIQGLERRLLFGSDAPNGLIAIADLAARLRALALPEEDEAAILGGTAEQLIAGY